MRRAWTVASVFRTEIFHAVYETSAAECFQDGTVICIHCRLNSRRPMDRQRIIEKETAHYEVS